jgi:hypothetical protein
MLRAYAVLLFLLSFPTITFAQTGIVTEPDSLLLRESQDILVRNVTEETVRIDSLQFSQHSFSGWTLAIGTIEDPLRWTPEGLYYAIGRLYFWQTFPEIELAPGDSALIHFGHLDRCVVCKASGIGDYVEIDTLFIFTDVGGADPYPVFLNFEEFMVSIEDETPTMVASFEVYPSPASESANVSIRLQEPGSVSIRVFDILGREVSQSVSAADFSLQHDVNLDTSAWAQGVYLVRIETRTTGNRQSSLTRTMIVAR